MPAVSGSYRQPLWDGAFLGGKTILLYAEQGLGDTLQFVRYARLVHERGGTVIFECPAPLVRLVQSARTSAELFRNKVRCRHSIPMLRCCRSAGNLATDLASVPGGEPYLFPMRSL